MSPKITTPSEWRTARLALLEKEKAHAKQADIIAQELRNLPMVPVTKDYKFDAPDGTLVTMKDLFAGRSQLIIYHFMFGPDDEEGCRGCSFLAGNFPDLRYLAEKDTTLAVISRAPISKISSFKSKIKWSFPWYSSHGSTFSHDFNETVEYSEEITTTPDMKGDEPGISIFKLGESDGGQVYHTYSSYHRLDRLIQTYVYLDLTPAGRQEGPRGPAEFKLPFEYEGEGGDESEMGAVV